MSDSGHNTHGDHGEIHLPPNSFVPICLAFSLMITLVGVLIHPVVWITGLVLTIATLVQWFRAARTEFNELPD